MNLSWFLVDFIGQLIRECVPFKERTASNMQTGCPLCANFKIHFNWEQTSILRCWALYHEEIQLFSIRESVVDLLCINKICYWDGLKFFDFRFCGFYKFSAMSPALRFIFVVRYLIIHDLPIHLFIPLIIHLRNIDLLTDLFTNLFIGLFTDIIADLFNDLLIN